jgi:hypothetical protein
VNAALDLAAAIDAERRTKALEAFRDLLDQLDTDLIENDRPTTTHRTPHDLPRRHLHGGPAAAWTGSAAEMDRSHKGRARRHLPGGGGGTHPWEWQHRRADDTRDLLHTLFGWHPMPDDAWRFVEQTQNALVDLGQHKRPSVVDLLIAATAEAWGLTVLRVDADFETIARVASIRTVRADKP